MNQVSSNAHEVAEPDPRNPPSLQSRRAALAALLMGCAAAGAWKLTPTIRMAAQHGDVQLEQMLPKQFGAWRMDEYAVGGVVNPQQEAMLKQIYSQTLSRTYLNGRGQRVMLSIAYGQDQRDAMQLHYPEICYPSQGFQLKGKLVDKLSLPFGDIPVRRLETVLGSQRYEPVTYWTVVGDRATLGGVDKKLIEMSYGLKGVIVDGLLFRVSSIDRDTAQAYALQDQFVGDLLTSLSPAQRRRLAGLSR